MNPSEFEKWACKVRTACEGAIEKESREIDAEIDDYRDACEAAVMPIIEELATERDDLRAKLEDAYTAIRSLYVGLSVWDKPDADKFPAVMRAKDAKP